MNVGLIDRLLGGDRVWGGPCTVIVTAAAGVTAAGMDTVGGSGQPSYAPRQATGRIDADAACLVKDQSALLVIRQLIAKDGTGTEQVRHTLLVLATEHVAGFEFNGTQPLRGLGIPTPFIPDDTGYRPGTVVG